MAARGEERARTLAIADFAVRAEAAHAVQYAWLGAAVPELLQAKLQLFAGARVLERLRLEPRMLENVPTTAENAPRIVAEILLLGSVEIAPGVGAAPSIKVQARAVETETGRIISEATFTGSTELAGLLRIAEELARTLADGLGLSYTPAQLAYAEPAGIEALQFYLEGNELLAGERPREAVEAYQRALDGNGGRFYGAAHRAQGEAYQQLSRSLSGAAAREASEEYLKKFKADALTASGALFDLGVALEANGLWREAIGAYEDYLKVVGTEGETVKWTFTPEKDLAMPRAWIPHPAVAEAGRIHLLVINGQPSTDTRWVMLDSRTGTVIQQFPIHELLGAGGDDVREMRLFGADSGTVYYYWYGAYGEIGQPRPNDRHYGNPWVAAVNISGQVLWKTPIGSDRQYVGGDAMAFQGRLMIKIADGETVVLTAADGRILHRYPASAGIYDLASDRLLQNSFSTRPTGVAGVTATFVGTKTGDVIRLLSDGKPVLEIKDHRLFERSVRPNPRGWIMFTDILGWKLIAINPEDWSALDLYRELEVPVTPLGQDDGYLVFALQNDPKGSMGIDPRYGLASTMKGTAINIVSKTTRTVAGKTFLKSYDWIALDGHDLIINAERAISRHNLVTQGVAVVVPSGEAHLRLAGALLALNDGPSAQEHLARFEAQSPGDPRAALLRMRLASDLGDNLEAGRFSLAALASGGVSDADAQSCLAAIRAARPEVRDFVITPVKSRLQIRALIGPGLLACTPYGQRTNLLHVIVDTITKRTTLVQTPECDQGFSIDNGRHLYHNGKDVYILQNSIRGDEVQLFKKDLLSGKLITGETHGYYRGDFIPGMPYWVRTHSHSFRFDPEDLKITDIDLVNREGFRDPAVIGNPTVIARSNDYSCNEPAASFLVLDPDRGKEIGLVSVPLDQEKVFAIAADRDRLIVGINGGDFRHYLTGREGIWFRIESFPLGPDAQRWSYRGEGRIAGNIIIDGANVVFPAYEGRLPVPKVEIIEGRWYDYCVHKEKNHKEQAILQGPELVASRVTIGLRDGGKIAAEPLQANPWDNWQGPKRGNSKTIFDRPCEFCETELPIYPSSRQKIFPGLGLSRSSLFDSSHPDVCWPATPDRVPLRISPETRGEEYLIVLDDYESTLGHKYGEPETFGAPALEPILSWKDTVYEPIGGGVILVKDFAGGNGLERIARVLGRR